MVEEQLLSNGWLKEPHAENNVFPHHKGFSCYFVLFCLQSISRFCQSCGWNMWIELNIYHISFVQGFRLRVGVWWRVEPRPRTSRFIWWCTVKTGCVWQLGCPHNPVQSHGVTLPWMGHTQSPKLQTRTNQRLIHQFGSLFCLPPPCICWHLFKPWLLLICIVTC